MAALTLNTPKPILANPKKLIVHAFVAILASVYLFVVLPSYNSNNYHLWSLFILAVLDILNFYFFALVVFVNGFKRKGLYVGLGILMAFLFLYCSSGLNMMRTDNRILKITAATGIQFNKSWFLYTLPRLALILGASFLYYLFFVSAEKRKKIIGYLQLEWVINILLVAGLIYYKDIFEPFTIDSAFFVILVVGFYVHFFLLAPFLIVKKKYRRYALYLVLMYIINGLAFCAVLYFYDQWQITELPYIFGISPISLTAVLLVSLTYAFIRHKIVSRLQNISQELGTTTAELQLLKSQVNPHFLFNTLNTLYATALEENAEVTASSTAKLANLVRYMQQDIHRDFIPLERELGYVTDYITIQELRIASPIEIDTQFENINDTQISPGLLIPFVENAFKYGVDPDGESVIHITALIKDGSLFFTCQNNFDESQKTYYREKGFGIGIKNTRQRLELIYPRRHSLKIEKKGDLFIVSLTIKINSK